MFQISRNVLVFQICLINLACSFIHSRFISKGSGFGIARPYSNGEINYPSSANCTEFFFAQQLDHFSYISDNSYLQRYFICDQFWKKNKNGEKGPIFFYVGNEADVTLYVNATGLMWENAPRLGALLVFAEHRYYGKSQPFNETTKQNIGFLSSEQALADYATLIDFLKDSLTCHESPIIAFGGSYGGMLATWFRVKYPHLVDGAIAASAPIWHFLGDNPEPDPYAFAAITTRDASQQGGATDSCKENVRATWAPLFSLGASTAGREQISRNFKLCSALESSEKVHDFAGWIQEAWSTMAMGNFPFASSYLLNGEAVLPPWPVRKACVFLESKALEGSIEDLLRAHSAAIGVLYNATGDVTCYDWDHPPNDANTIVGEHWFYQHCTEMFMPMGTNGVTDMFWNEPFDIEAEKKRCFERWGVIPRTTWARTQYGGHRLGTTTNIAFSNGLFDPWSGTGVLESISEDLPVLLIEEGAHHLDLMFSTPNDPVSVVKVRAEEVRLIKKWIAEAYQKNKGWTHAKLHQSGIEDPKLQVLS